MAALLPSAELQFADANGAPYAGGSLQTLIPGTTTPKATWQDADGTLNDNPITLDSAGRCIVFGDGSYRTILKDAAGNQIWDALTSTLVSAAMAPVILAPTIADAVLLLGIPGLIADEANARVAGDTAEAAARVAADALEGEQRVASDAQLAALIAGIPAPGAAPAPIMRGGHAVSDAGGRVRITFSPAFTSACTSFVAMAAGTSGPIAPVSGVADRTGADCWATFPSTGTAAAGVGFNWIALGD